MWQAALWLIICHQKEKRYLINLAALLKVQDLWNAVYGAVVVVSQAELQPGCLAIACTPLAALVACYDWHDLPIDKKWSV